MEGYGSAGAKAHVEPGAGAPARSIFLSYLVLVRKPEAPSSSSTGQHYFTLKRAFIPSSPMPENSICLDPCTAIPLHLAFIQ